MHNQFAAVLANARKPPLASRTASTNSLGAGVDPSRYVRSNSSCISKKGQRSLYSRLHCYQKTEKLQKKEVVDRLQKERFLAMLQESLNAPIIEEDKPRINYKNVKLTKSVIMKKDHTTAKIDRLNSKPFFGNQKYLMALANAGCVRARRGRLVSGSGVWRRSGCLPRRGPHGPVRPCLRSAGWSDP